MTDEEKPRPHFALHVDTDNPRVIDRGNGAFWFLPKDADPDAPPPGPLGPEWREVGYTTEEQMVDLGLGDIEVADAQRRLLDSLPVTTNWHTRSMHVKMTDIAPESLRIALGIDPARDDLDPTLAIQAKGRIVRPPTAPRKRRGLTGKRYRIARRRYAREVKAWKRGEWGTPVDFHYYFPHVRAQSIDAYVRRSLTRKGAAILPDPSLMRGHEIRFSVVDEANDLSDER